MTKAGDREMKRLAFAAVLAAWFGNTAPADATLVDHGSYATDTATSLNWYNLTLVQGVSYDQLSGLLATSLAGWQLATASQVAQLFVDAGLPATMAVYGAPGYTSQVQALAAAIGDTLALHPAAQYVAGVAAYYQPTPAMLAAGSVPVANAMLDVIGNATIGGPGLSGSISSSVASLPYAPYLVSAAAPEPVAEPTTLAQIGGGLLVLAALRRQRRRI
jgi:hypothetical protein